MTIPYIVTKDSVTVMYNGVTTTVRDGMLNYASLREAIRNKDWDSIPNLLNPARAVESFGNGAIEVRDGEVYYQGEIMRNGLTRRILEMVGEGFDADPLTKFLGKLMDNPSKTAVDELYSWLEGTNLPITEDGCFMAYKKVGEDYLDYYTGKVLNKPAEFMTDADLEYIKNTQGVVSVEVTDGVTTVSMPRNKVDDNRDRTCSQGLHFCSLSYLPHYHGGRGRVLLVKVDPADVVSIPSDYDNAKGRAWRYQIVGEHADGETREAYKTPVATTDGKPTYGRQFLTEDVNTLVLGVNFGTEDRATLVRDMIADCSRQLGTSRTGEQGRVDGFDDAWNKADANLSRFTGSNMREAVEYAQAYFEGYDKCNGFAPQVQVNNTEAQDKANAYSYETVEQRDEIIRVLSMPINKNGARHGYDNGYDDGRQDAESDKRNGRSFNLEAAIPGGKNYRDGYIAAYVDIYCW